MNAVVTGGAGFLGRSLLRALQSRCRQVRVLVRNPGDDPLVHALGAMPIRGDLTIPGGCGGLVREGDVVFHAAARVDMTGAWSEFLRTTVEGTRRLLKAALPCHPSRFVYVSSASVYSPTHARGGAAADRTPARPPNNNLYARAKLVAEDAVRAECNRSGCPWVVVRLGFLYGPGNRALFRHFVPLLERGRLRIIGNGLNRIATLYVDDAASAVLLAGSHPAAPGRIYDVASDEPVTQRQYLEATAAALGLPPPTRHVPRALAYAAASLSELTARLRGREPDLTRAMVTLMSFDQVLDAGRIRDELAWKPQVSFDEGMQQVRAWCSKAARTDSKPAGPQDASPEPLSERR